jgi:hypothetical protein
MLTLNMKYLEEQIAYFLFTKNLTLQIKSYN